VTPYFIKTYFEDDRARIWGLLWRPDGGAVTVTHLKALDHATIGIHYAEPHPGAAPLPHCEFLGGGPCWGDTATATHVPTSDVDAYLEARMWGNGRIWNFD
jgi:hypothetical protein